MCVSIYRYVLKKKFKTVLQSNHKHLGGGEGVTDGTEGTEGTDGTGQYGTVREWQ